MPETPVPIISTGFGWTAAGAWLTAVTALIGLVTLIVRQVGPWKKQTTDADEKLRSDLMGRCDGLEKQVDALRTELTAHHDRCDRIIAEIRAQHALEMHDLRERHLVDLANALTRKIEKEAGL
jgi:hypothetical protein